VARLQQISLSAQRVLITRTATDKMKGLRDKPVAQWREELFKNWNPKRDFAYAMLHAERLTRMMTDAAIAEILLEQSKQHPERADVLKRYLVRAEPRCRHLLDEIQTTGAELLAKLQQDEKQTAQAAE